MYTRSVPRVPTSCLGDKNVSAAATLLESENNAATSPSTTTTHIYFTFIFHSCHYRIRTMNSSDIQEKSEEYAKFLRNILNPNLQAALEKERHVQQEIHEYGELRDNLRVGIPSQLSVDLGYGKIRCNATIEANPHVFVNVGMGFHVELNADEAAQFCQQRIRFLQTQVLPKRRKDSETIRQHIRESEMILDAIAVEIK